MAQSTSDAEGMNHDSTATCGAGTSRSILKLWEGTSSTGQPVWLEKRPERETKKSALDNTGYSITLLHRDRKQNGEYTLDTIIVRSNELQGFFEDVIPNISSFYSELDKGIRIDSPFRLFYWYLDQIIAVARDHEKKLGEDATLLQGVLEEEFHVLHAKRQELLSKREINFNIVWTLFKPAITCLINYANNSVAVKVASVQSSRDAMGQFYYRIHHHTLGWNGEYLGWQDSYTDIFEFNGRQKITNLEIYPIEFSKDPNIISHIVQRGRRFVALAIREPQLMSFHGEVLDSEATPIWRQSEQRAKMSERVVLDARAYSHYRRRISVSQWKKSSEMTIALTAQDDGEGLFLYCCPEMRCFALQKKRWATVWIDHVDEVVFDELAYPSLVLPNDYKKLLLSFAEAQINGSEFDDVISGKGQGILMLLAGPPGTGKTLTAEAMAEHMKRPLYSVSMGELGAATGGLEKELDRVLELSTRWNAVLLLDEADVFLQKRVDNDLQRNTVVSVFLKKLEYYRGIMFLTTNRIGSFDEAFKSRIHVAIRYPDLDPDARRSIWGNFLHKTQTSYQYGVGVTQEEVDQLSQKTLNGREIRNIVKSAQLLASRSKEILTKDHIETVWRVEHEDSPW